jgi:hypothetical protein
MARYEVLKVNRLSVTDLYIGSGMSSSVFSSGGTLQMASSGTGYSHNLISVTSTEGNTRALRVNLTTNASVASGDLQCVHGYLTLGTSATIAAAAAVYPLSAWLDIPDSTTVGAGTVLAGCRVIFDPNNNALGSGTLGCESALFYGQTWASTGTIDAGLFLAAGAGSTIDSAIELGSGTFGVIMDMTSWGKDTTMILAKGGPKDATETAHWVFAVGDADSHADIVTALGGTSYGSLFMSTTGAIWVNKAGTWTDCTA